MSELRVAAIAFDTGGTFTDLAMLLSDGGVLVDKVLSTPRAPARAVLTGIDRLLERAGSAGAVVARPRVIGATTVVTNAVLERTGARTALLVTEGFTDVLAIRDESRYDLYDLQLEFPEPLVPAERTLPVRERTRVDGSPLLPVDEAQVVELAAALRALEVESVAVCLLHAHTNPSHEQVVEQVLRAHGDFDISLSSVVSGEVREYERASTTTVNAYTRPLMRAHVVELCQRLAERGLGELSMMTSSGNVVPGAEAAAHPVRMIESGPAAGALGAGRHAGLAGDRPILAFDMGGTTAKLCVLLDGRPVIARGLEVDRQRRFAEGSGIPLGIQSVKLIEIGAGGGSIAHVDHLGLLAIGPHSAGADPGPACYGRGGTAATVTDADLVLGFLDAERFLGGRMALDLPAARASVARLADELGVTPRRCAWGIHELANDMMARSAAAQALESGVDPSACVLVAFGGAGPTHAHGIAARLGIDTVVCPAGAGIATALGLLGAPVAYDCAQSLFVRLDTVDPDVLRDAAGRLLRRGEQALGRTVVSQRFSADMRYVGQGHEITVPVPDPLDPAVPFAAGARDAFTRTYRGLYSRELPGRDIELTVLRLTAVAQPATDAGRVRRDHEMSPPRSRRVATGPDADSEHAVLNLAGLAPDATLVGPAVVEQTECTALLPAGWSARMADSGDLVMVRDGKVGR